LLFLAATVLPLCSVAATASGPPAARPGAGEQEVVPPPRLVAGGKVALKNDLQAWADAMLLFRRFRNEFEHLEGFEIVDAEEEADLVAILSGDPQVIGQHGIVNRGIPYPSGYATSKVMFLVIVDAQSNELLWFDAEDWDTTRNMTQVDSHAKLVRRLAAALDRAG
jgi:hypothetical protein